MISALKVAFTMAKCRICDLYLTCHGIYFNIFKNLYLNMVQDGCCRDSWTDEYPINLASSSQCYPLYSNFCPFGQFTRYSFSVARVKATWWNH